MKCSWEDCKQVGTCPQRDKAGKEWARLCTTHDAELDQAVASGEAKSVMRAWVRAQGGVIAAAKRATR